MCCKNAKMIRMKFFFIWKETEIEVTMFQKGAQIRCE